MSVGEAIDDVDKAAFGMGEAVAHEIMVRTPSTRRLSSDEVETIVGAYRDSLKGEFKVGCLGDGTPTELIEGIASLWLKRFEPNFRRGFFTAFPPTMLEDCGYA